jgi:hypothetical protein
MRRDLHKDRAVPALYLATRSSDPHPCTVRVFEKFEPLGTLANAKGYAQMQSETPRLVFIADDAPPVIRRGAIVSVEPGEAYLIDTVQPPDDITTTATVTRLDAADAADLPLPSDG